MKNIEVICECGSRSVIKKGVRRNKLEVTQLYMCRDCGKIFSYRELKNKKYDVGIVIKAISLYNLGFNLDDTRKRINKKFKIKVGNSTIHNWIKEFRDVCSYYRLREGINKKYKPSELIKENIFEHIQSYRFRYHKAKLDLLVNNYFSGLKKYIEEIKENCPDKLFYDSDRCSSIKFDNSACVKNSRNYACKLAEIALKIVKNNSERHEMIQEFMLVNDTCTVAVEVPVYLYEDEANGIYTLNNLNGNVTGHIDILQLRYGKVYVLDYKPNAVKIDAVSQLFMYAFALSARTGIWLRNFRCAWFDEKDYFEFNPSEIILENEKLDSEERKKYVSDYARDRFVVSNGFKRWRRGETE